MLKLLALAAVVALTGCATCELHHAHTDGYKRCFVQELCSDKPPHWVRDEPCPKEAP